MLSACTSAPVLHDASQEHVDGPDREKSLGPERLREDILIVRKSKSDGLGEDLHNCNETAIYRTPTNHVEEEEVVAS